jgi:LAO/AO transport system kinase
VPETARPVPGYRRDAPPDALLDAAAGGDRRALARLLTHLEKGGATGRRAAALAYRAGIEARTVGITGPPGAGKSTLVASLIGVARAGGVEQLAVLAVDPSSPFSGGAILGDRVRMQDHALDDGVYIRSMASRGHLGGLSVAVPEAIRILAAAGFPLVLVETVGVGQVEVEVAGATDTTVVVLNPRWGDAVQANKAGLLETADIFVINKADMPGVRETRRDLEQMMELSAPSDWRPPVVETVASTGEGVEKLWEELARHQEHLRVHGALDKARHERILREFRAVLAAGIRREVERLESNQLAELERRIAEHRVDPYEAAEELLAGIRRRAATDGPGTSSP